MKDFTIKSGNPFFANRWVRAALALFAGCLLPFAFAPHHFWILGILSPAILLWLWSGDGLRTVDPYGFLFGIGMFGVGVSWVFVSIHRYGNTDVPMAVFITLLLVIILALFIACHGVLLRKLFKGSRLAFCLLGFPSSWVLFEWIRSWLFTGFPWLYLGYAALDIPVGNYAPITSVYGVSLAIAFTSGSLVAFFQGNQKIKLTVVSLVLLIWGTGYLLNDHPFTQAIEKTYNVSLIQGNVAPLDKFSQSDPLGVTDRIYGELTKPVWDSSDIILWPESAVPYPLPYSADYVKKLDELAKSHNTTLITGIQFTNEQKEYHNSLIALGKGEGIYHKYHLLPYGDYLPFDDYLRGLTNFFNLPMSSFVPGASDQPLIKANDLWLDPLICYEIAFPELVQKTLRNADAIITLSEDGWFGESWGPHQHLQIAQMRALETGRYVLRATTCGITAIIDPKGKITASLPQFQAAVLKGKFHAMTGDTPWVKIGIWPLLIFLILCFILPRFFRKIRKTE